VYSEIFDFNGAAEYFAEDGMTEWREIAKIIDDLVPSFQASEQAGIQGSPIFDPKATNFSLSTAAKTIGWRSVPVPSGLQSFGDDWDSGKNRTLAEWQFSNYPFLWNNVIRTEAVFQQNIPLVGLEKVEALLIVTKSGIFPSSNSSLYYEQAKAQLDVATTLNVFDVPIRLLGLSVPPNIERFDAVWTTYAGRTSRTIVGTDFCEIGVSWTGGSSKYGVPTATFQRI
jgi:hypothetical protein